MEHVVPSSIRQGVGRLVFLFPSLSIIHAQVTGGGDGVRTRDRRETMALPMARLRFKMRFPTRPSLAVSVQLQRHLRQFSSAPGNQSTGCKRTFPGTRAFPGERPLQLPACHAFSFNRPGGQVRDPGTFFGYSDVVPGSIPPGRFSCAWRLAQPEPAATRVFHTSIFSISPTQWAGPSVPSLKRMIVSNTASEKPPTFKMSSRSGACVVP